MHDLPLLLVALTVSAYWIGVGRMVVRVRRRRHDGAGLVLPEQPLERVMWLGFWPLVAAWIVLPWLALRHPAGALAVPAFAHEGAYEALRILAAIVGIGALLATVRCWRRMGSDWRMDVSTQHTVLITDGPFRRIRHPIYAFQVLLVLCTAVVLPCVAMLVVAAVHVALMHVKARNEESYLAAVHGAEYARYAARTGRFVPRLWPRAR